MAVIVVPTDWTMYEVDDNVLVFLNSAVAALPPFMVMEALVMNGKARRIQDQTLRDTEPEAEPTEGDGPWFTGSEEDDAGT